MARGDETIGDRLRKAIRAVGYGRAIDFATKHKIKSSTLYATLNNQTKIPGAQILAACQEHDINIMWLLYGDGEMIMKTREGDYDLGDHVLRDDVAHYKPKSNELISQIMALDEQEIKTIYNVLKAYLEGRVAE
ncbi:MAG: helix-turn-helix domain-containing protein [bacterium]